MPASFPANAAFFRPGTKSPKKFRSKHKPPPEKRRTSFKKGINAQENRKRRSKTSRDLGNVKKKTKINNHRNKTNTIESAGSKPAIDKIYTGTTKEKMVAFYKDHNPAKLGNVDKSLTKYAGKEEQLLHNLAKRYGIDPKLLGVGALSLNAGSGAGLFGSLASTSNASSFGAIASAKGWSGGFKTSGGSSTGQGRKTITSLKTLSAEPRDTDDTMDCE